jgi:hypothetical protein
VPEDIARRRVGVAGLGYDLEPVLRLEQQAQRAADDGVVVGEDDRRRRVSVVLARIGRGKATVARADRRGIGVFNAGGLRESTERCRSPGAYRGRLR